MCRPARRWLAPREPAGARRPARTSTGSKRSITGPRPRSAAPVAINLRAARRTEIGGVERVARELARALLELRPERYRPLWPPSSLAHRAGHLWEQGLLPVVARSHELLLSPANTAPALAANNVVGMFDAASVRHPEWYGSAYARWQGLLLPRLAARARLLVTASRFGREELVEVLGADPGRVAVVALGVDSRFVPAADPAPARRTYGLERPYVLALGSMIARKNLGVLHEAARRLEQEGIELVVAGSGRGYMRPEESPPGRPLGYVADGHLPGLYAGARAAVVPSRYEGFGLPCLEAMACGTPLVAANATALPETCGDAALLVDPDDAAGFADALVTVVGDGSLREGLRRRGLERAHRFTWRRTAGLIDAELQKLLRAP